MKGSDGKIYILDFSVSNWYPRIQEIAVIAANLLYDREGVSTLRSSVEAVVGGYERFAPLTDIEKHFVYTYTLAGVAMEFMGAHQEKYINGNDTQETDFWINLGRNGLKRELDIGQPKL